MSHFRILLRCEGARTTILSCFAVKPSFTVKNTPLNLSV
jgi:hypothetical protein